MTQQFTARADLFLKFNIDRTKFVPDEQGGPHDRKSLVL